MTQYIVRLTDTDQGYADDAVFGTFRTRKAAEDWAQKVMKRVTNEDVRYVVDGIQRPLMRNVEADSSGWFEPGDEY